YAPSEVCRWRVSRGLLGDRRWPRLASRALAVGRSCWQRLRLHLDAGGSRPCPTVSPSHSAGRIAERGSGRSCPAVFTPAVAWPGATLLAGAQALADHLLWLPLVPERVGTGGAVLEVPPPRSFRPPLPHPRGP